MASMEPPFEAFGPASLSRIPGAPVEELRTMSAGGGNQFLRAAQGLQRMVWLHQSVRFTRVVGPLKAPQ